ncbi:ABC transporter permease [Dictyobacter sp. S3.2.2.5]|uniref:ABC transporter permease n=1 Tax=Dictyobacter halimunensis TaxID=3026934 RepID=A0ABQ6FJM8_9CHLR|nr:ABC transporter permease [Dictyobacter sp. S3.2.2.5]
MRVGIESKKSLAHPRTHTRGSVLVKRLSLKVIIYLLLIIISLIVAIPFFWMVSTSLKTVVESSTFPPSLLPSVPQWHDYADVFQAVPFLNYLSNTIFYALAVMVGQFVCCSLAAFAFARMDFPGRNVLFVLYLTTLLIPATVTLVPSFIMMKTFGWLDTIWAMTIPGMLGSAFGTFMLRQYMLSIPRELDDAAMLDGASPFYIYWKIVLPLCKPALTVLSVITIMTVWNDFMWPLVMLQSDSVLTLTLGLASFTSGGSETFVSVPLSMAASTMTVLPLILIFFIAQRYFIRGIALSGLGGR